MRLRILRVGLSGCALALGLCALPDSAVAQAKPKSHAAAGRKPLKKNPKRRVPPSSSAATDATDATATDHPGEPATAKPAGTEASRANAPDAEAASVKEDKSGVKTYRFGTVEVEGRMKSPQIIYFLRRVRAEFDAGLLGHRSFLRELSDTRNNPSFR